jgi:hypothetical protein
VRHEKMTDSDNITDARYETVMLRGKQCMHCQDDFAYVLHKNKRVFKKTEKSFYRVVVAEQSDAYLHVDCMMPLLLTDGLASAQRIDLLDRFGRNLNKVNYVKRLDGMLAKHHEVECIKQFKTEVKHLYAWEQDFPRYFISFKGDVGEFERIRAKYKDVVLRLTPEDVRLLFYK